MIKDRTIKDVQDERNRQDKKWGKQSNHPYLWNTILGEEVGEVNQASLDCENGTDTQEHLEEELVQVIAVAIAYLEDIRSGK